MKDAKIVYEKVILEPAEGDDVKVKENFLYRLKEKYDILVSNYKEAHFDSILSDIECELEEI